MPSGDLFPVYCRRCRQATPAAQLDANGHCPACAPVVAHEAIARAEMEAARERARLAMEESQRQAFAATDTHMGACSQCGARNIRQFTTRTGGGGAMEASCCIGCLFFWPLLILAPFLGRGGRQIHRQCRACGHQWLA